MDQDRNRKTPLLVPGVGHFWTANKKIRKTLWPRLKQNLNHHSFLYQMKYCFWVSVRFIQIKSTLEKVSTSNLSRHKSHEISLMILHQIFKKISEDPQVRWPAYRGCDLSKISKRFLLKIFGRSQRDFLEILEWSSFKILLRSSADIKKILNEDLKEIFFRNLIEISWRFYMKIFRPFVNNWWNSFKTKNSKKNREDFYWRSSKDLKKILIADLRKIQIRFKLKILKDLNKIFLGNFIKIFWRK